MAVNETIMTALANLWEQIAAEAVGRLYQSTSGLTWRVVSASGDRIGVQLADDASSPVDVWPVAALVDCVDVTPLDITVIPTGWDYV